MPTVSPALAGELFVYAQGRVAFENLSRSTHKCVLLGGLSDGLMPVPYVAPLQEAIAAKHWSLVQPILSSSYTGFGHGSLDRDVLELDELFEYLVEARGAEQISMVGHSTGTQDIVHYLKHGKHTDLIRVVALQAPVSDRESSLVCHGRHEAVEEHKRAFQEHLDFARSMRDGQKDDEMMPRSAFWAPITANRYLALNEKGGNDDYFSSDYSDDELNERLCHIGRLPNLKCLVACSGSDEYVPDFVNVAQLLERMVQAMNSGGCEGDGKVAIPLLLPDGNHNLSSSDGTDAELFVETFVQLLETCAG